MLQIIQSLKSGETTLESIPSPGIRTGNLLIQTHRTLVSLGTERMLVEFGRSNLMEKALREPARVKEVLSKIRTDGISPTIAAVRRKLDAPLPLGYCNAGVVIGVGSGVSGFKVGDRVVSNGPHAEFVTIPHNLASIIPEGVSFDAAPFAVVGAIALQGIRLAEPTFGETVVVVGLGLIGLIAIQILKSSGCRVIGIDISEDKLKRASSYGIEVVNSSDQDFRRVILELTGQKGVDAVLITASSDSKSLINDCADICRKRGRIILVGVVGLQLDRARFYKKEITFQVSCSYGPGRYEKEYEEAGIDLPLAYVRWSAQRNFEAILRAIAEKQIDVESLITERVPLADFMKIYGMIGNTNSIASLIEYGAVDHAPAKRAQLLQLRHYESIPRTPQFAVIGSGNFAQSTLLPQLKNRAQIKYLVSSSGVSSTHLAKKFKVPFSGTDFESVLGDKEVRSVFLVTRHNLHAPMAVRALKASKHVFVEKPLAITREQLNEVAEALKDGDTTVMVGFNRRFSPHTIKIKSLLGTNPGPMSVVATMNAGYIAPDSWLHDQNVGGGRIIGEACHHIDLVSHIIGSPIAEVCMQSVGLNPDHSTDQASILIKCINGSLGVINYFSQGNKAYSKERIEVFCGGKTLICDNFRSLYGYGFSKGLSNRLLKTSLDKGHQEQFRRYVEFIKVGGYPLIPFEEIRNVTSASFAALESLTTKAWVSVV